MTLENWCRTHLEGGFIVVPDRLSSVELARVPLRRRGDVLLTVCDPRDGRECGLTAQRFGARKAHATGVRWKVGLSRSGRTEPRRLAREMACR